MSTCAKPGCGGSAICVLSYDYAGRVATLEDPGPDPISPHVYAFCGPCAERLQPPRGWSLEDNRTRPPLFLTGQRSAAPATQAAEAADEDEEELEGSQARQLFFGQSA